MPVIFTFSISPVLCMTVHACYFSRNILSEIVFILYLYEMQYIEIAFFLHLFKLVIYYVYDAHDLHLS